MCLVVLEIFDFLFGEVEWRSKHWLVLLVSSGGLEAVVQTNAQSGLFLLKYTCGRRGEEIDDVILFSVNLLIETRKLKLYSLMLSALLCTNCIFLCENSFENIAMEIIKVRGKEFPFALLSIKSFKHYLHLLKQSITVKIYFCSTVYEH